MDKESYNLIINARDGNLQSLNALFVLWYPKVYQMAYRYFSDDATAKDVCQQTFLLVQQKLSQLKDPQGFKGWLYRSAINCCHSESRNRKRQQKNQDNASLNDSKRMSIFPDQKLHLADQKRLLEKALQSIPAEQRLVIIMKNYEGLKFREIAEILAESESTVKSRLYYGLKGLKAYFDQHVKENLLSNE